MLTIPSSFGRVGLRSINSFVGGITIVSLLISPLVGVFSLPARAAAETLVSLYAQPTKNTYSNFNDGTVRNAYAWQFTASTSGVPATITLSTDHVTGSPTGDICIRADKTAASTSYGCATGVRFTAGDNVITLSGARALTAGTAYWVYFIRTSAASSDFPSFQYKYPTAGAPLYRASAPDSDPTTLWFSYDMAMSVNGLVDPVFTGSGTGLVPASEQVAVNTLTIYDQSNRNNYSNFNDNGPGENYAWKWAPIANGIPNRIRLWTDHVTGTPTGDICIRATQSTTSPSYGCATGVTFKAGENIISLTGGQMVTWEGGKSYFVHFKRTSDANNYPSFQYRYPQTDLPVYKSSVANGEPTIRWFNYNIAMTIENVQTVEKLSVFIPAPVLAYSQTQANNYSNFNWNAANDTYAWMWEPTEDVVPTQIIIPTERVTGTATGIFCIRATRAIDSISYGCSADTKLKTGDNLITLTPTGTALSKLGVYYVHFTRTSSLDSFPSFKYLDTQTYYPVFRSEQANSSPAVKWFSHNITMTIRGTAPTAPTAESQMIYGLSREEAQKVYDQLSTIPRSQGSISAGRSRVAPAGFELAAKENPRYYYMYVFLVPERVVASYGGDMPRELIITYDELGSKLGKAPVTSWLGITQTVDKTGYIYGMPRAEAEALYQVFKNEIFVLGSKMSPYLDAGRSEVMIGSGSCVKELGFHYAWNGLYRFGPGNVEGWLMLTKKEAEAKGFVDMTYEEAYNNCFLPYHFLRPGFIASQSTTSVTSGISKAISFPVAELSLAISFEKLEKTLGYPASGVTTPNLVYVDAPITGLVPIEYPVAPANITLVPAVIQIAPAPTSITSDQVQVAVPISSKTVILSERIKLSNDTRSGFVPAASVAQTRTVEQILKDRPALKASGAIDIIVGPARNGWAPTEGFLNSLDQAIQKTISEKCTEGNSILGTVRNVGRCAALVAIGGGFNFVNGVIDDVKIVVTGSDLKEDRVSGWRYGLAMVGVGSFFVEPALKGMQSLTEAVASLRRAGVVFDDIGLALKTADGLSLDPGTAARLAKDLDLIAAGKNAGAAKSDFQTVLKTVAGSGGAVDSLWQRALQIAQHSYQKHVIRQAEYAGIKIFSGVDDFAQFVHDIMKNPTQKISGFDATSKAARTLFWDEKTGTIVIDFGLNPTAFRPSRGYAYYLEQVEDMIITP